MDLRAMGRNIPIFVAYGDAFGLPYETSKRDPMRIVKHLMPIDNLYLGEHPAGTWSDDTHLTLATEVALTRAKGFSMDAIAAAHIEAYDETIEAKGGVLAAAILTEGDVSSWGKGTTDAIMRLKRGGFPAHTGEAGAFGVGTGVLMKMSPLVLWQIAKKIPYVERLEQVRAFTRMTHNNDASVAASNAYADILRALTQGARVCEVFDVAEDEEELKERTPKRGFVAWEALEVAAFYFDHDPVFPRNIGEAVKYGGDSDSICSMMGAMSVFANSFTWPADVSRLHDYTRIGRIGQEFAEIL